MGHSHYVRKVLVYSGKGEYLGIGTYTGDVYVIWDEKTSSLQEASRQKGAFKTPKIVLDNQRHHTVYGCRVWWREADAN